MDHYQRLNDWFQQSAAGQYLLHKEKCLLEKALEELFGYHLLVPGGQAWLSACQKSPIAHRVSIIEAGSRGSLRARMNSLPFHRDSVDVLVLPHILEFSGDPHSILREAERVVHPDGHIVLLGFNPLSCYGLCRLLVGYRRRMPWTGDYFHPVRMSDWLKLLGFEVKNIMYAAFTPPIPNKKFLNRMLFMERLESTWLSPLGGVYLIVARNLTVAPGMMTPRWQRKRAIVKNGAVEPTTRAR